MAIFSLVVSAWISTKTKARQREFGEFGVGFAKGIVDGREKDTPLQVEDGIFYARSLRCR